ncbi:MAG: dephospho-CoA kinase [Phycisphaeraceae bacterium]|nr:dephospho-CoA kinase [Phycisphaeraceae bacterium]
MVLIRPWWMLVILVFVTLTTLWLRGFLIEPARADRPIAALIGALACVLLVSVLQWLSTRYTLDRERISASMGVVRRLTLEARLTSIEHVAMTRSFLERLLGVGTIGVATPASGGGYDVVWRSVGRPHERLALIRCAAALEHRDAGDQRRLPVLGLAGGVGSGKSHVARVFAGLGWRVIDSDALARDALDRSEVQAKLIEWWGREVLCESAAEGPNGGQAGEEPAGRKPRIDRKRVAAIVFADPEQRRRLEELIHPIVRSDRATMAEAALAQGACGVVVDAPLLFEAGVDRECDAVAFVECPRPERLARVARSRGWDETELERREGAQWPLERKLAACRFVIDNGPGAEPLERQAERIAHAMRTLDRAACLRTPGSP